MKWFPASVAALAGIFTPLALLSGAHATSLAFTQDLSTVLTSSGPQIPDQRSGFVLYPIGSLSNGFRSPFENTSQFASARYTAILSGGSATYNFAPSNVLSLFWGSPDAWNTLSFYSGVNGTGSLLGSVTGAATLINGIGHDLVTFLMSDGLFSSVVLSSTANAFEFSNLTASNTPTPTPLPGALPLFVAGLGLVALLARRRRRKAVDQAENAS